MYNEKITGSAATTTNPDLIYVEITADTTSAMPDPAEHPEWAAGSTLRVLEDGGRKYILGNDHEWKETPNFSGGGKGGDAPVKGVDYWTEEDKVEIVDDVKAAVPLVKVAEQVTFVNSVDEMTDTNKVYVMPDGHLYAYMKSNTASSYTFTADDFVADALNTNGALLGSGTPNRITTSSMIDLGAGKVSVYCPDPYQYIIYYYTDRAIANYIGKTNFKSGNIDDALADTISSGSMDGAKYCRISLRDSTDIAADLSGRIDEFVSNVIVSQTSETTTETFAWKSTGLSYNQPADYEDRIVALEQALGGVENGIY